MCIGWIALSFIVGIVLGWILRGFDVTKIVFYDTSRVNGDLLPSGGRIKFIGVKNSGIPVDHCFREVTYGS